VPAVGLAAMVAVGVANALFDVSVHTLLQRGSTNRERSAVFSILESAVGLGGLTGSLLGPAIVALFGAQAGLAVTGAVLPVLALVVYSRLGRLDRVTAVDETLVHLLREVDAFRTLPLTAIERVAAGAVPAEFAAGTALMREGDPGDQFFVIDDGEVEITIGGRRVDRLGHGTGVGEIALVRRSPRTATVTAATDVRCFCIDAPTFLAAVSGPTAGRETERIASAHLLRDEASGT
jgi:MFS family permease